MAMSGLAQEFDVPVERDMSTIEDAWYCAGFSDQFASGDLKDLTMAGRPMVAWRTVDGTVTVLDGRCVHKRFPLARGRFIEPDVLECAYHGFCYDALGDCTSIPAQTHGRIPRTAKLTRFPVVEQDGVVWVWPGDPDRSSDVAVPPTPEIGDPEFRTIHSEPIIVRAHYRLMIENLLDITHFYPLHADSVGDIENSRIPVDIERRDLNGAQSIGTVRRVSDYKLPQGLQDWFGMEVVDRIHTHTMLNPGITRVQMICAPPGALGTSAQKDYVFYHTHTPVDSETHIWHWSVNVKESLMSATQPPQPLANAIAADLATVGQQDVWALEEQQRMFKYQDRDYAEVHIKTDGAVVMVRNLFASSARQ